MRSANKVIKNDSERGSEKDYQNKMEFRASTKRIIIKTDCLPLTAAHAAPFLATALTQRVSFFCGLCIC